MMSYIHDGDHDVISQQKCCHLVSVHAASARRICSSQFLIHSTFVLVYGTRCSVQALRSADGMAAICAMENICQQFIPPSARVYDTLLHPLNARSN